MKKLFMLVVAVVLLVGATTAMAGEISVTIQPSAVIEDGGMWRILVYERVSGEFVTATQWLEDGDVLDINQLLPDPDAWRKYKVVLKCNNVPGYSLPTERAFYSPLWDGLLCTDMVYH